MLPLTLIICVVLNHIYRHLRVLVQKIERRRKKDRTSRIGHEKFLREETLRSRLKMVVMSCTVESKVFAISIETHKQEVLLQFRSDHLQQAVGPDDQ